MVALIRDGKVIGTIELKGKLKRVNLDELIIEIDQLLREKKVFSERLELATITEDRF